MYKQPILDKLLSDERRCEYMLRTIRNFHFAPTGFVKDLIDEHLHNLRRKRRTWLDMFESDHPYNMDFLGVR